MKKGKLLALLSVLMIAAMLLSSCGGAKKISKLGSFEKVLNSKYDYAEAVVEKATALTELDGYALVTSNEEFILFSDTNEETGMMTYKVFAYRSASVVATFSNNEDRTYSVSLDGDLPMFVVAKATEEKTTYTAYDAKGTEVVTTKYATSAPSKFGELVRYDDVLYAIEDDGKLTKSLEIPENLSLSAPDYWNDQYYYFTASRNVLVYDASLNFVSAWHAPSTAAYANFFVLDGGNVLVQYMDILDPYAEDYEVYITEMNDAGTVVVKYDLVTKLIAAKDGKAKDLKMGYYLQHVESATEINREYDEDEANKVLADGVKNLALIAPIVDKKVDLSDAAQDLVLMDNNGKLGKSVKVVANQEADLPELVADGVYLVDTLYGRVLANAKGKVLQALNNDSIEVYGDYLIGKKAIYNLSMEKVYDLVENDAAIYAPNGEPIMIDGTVFVIKGEDITKEYDIIAIHDGEETKVYSFSAEEAPEKEFAIVDGVGYVLKDIESGEYTYYNAACKELLKSKVALACVADSYEYETLIMAGADAETGKIVYFVFSK